LELFVFGDLDHFEVMVSGRVAPADHAALSRTLATLPDDVPMLVELRDITQGDLPGIELHLTDAASSRSAPTEIRIGGLPPLATTG
jgi:hypothetical protein